jgi:hypothetical protein
MHIEVEVLNIVTLNSSIFWEVTPCRLVDIYRCFRGKHCLQLQVRGVRQAINEHRTEIFFAVSLCWLFIWFTPQS